MGTFSSNEHDAVTGVVWATGLLKGAFRELHLSFILHLYNSRVFQAFLNFSNMMLWHSESFIYNVDKDGGAWVYQ